MVDVGFVVVNQSPCCACLCCSIDIPVEFEVHCALCFVLDFGNKVLDVCRSCCCLIIELELTYIELVVAVVTLYTKTDAFDYITVVDAVEGNLLLLPCLACEVAIWELHPCVAALLLEDEVEVRCCYILQSLHGELCICTVTGL